MMAESLRILYRLASVSLLEGALTVHLISALQMLLILLSRSTTLPARSLLVRRDSLLMNAKNLTTFKQSGLPILPLQILKRLLGMSMRRNWRRRRRTSIELRPSARPRLSGCERKGAEVILHLLSASWRTLIVKGIPRQGPLGLRSQPSCQAAVSAVHGHEKGAI